MLPAETGAEHLQEGAIQRGRRLLNSVARLPVVQSLSNPFLTVTGAGDLQIEWKQADKYFEVEIPPSGPFSIWYESAVEENELQVDDQEEIEEALSKFFES